MLVALTVQLKLTAARTVAQVANSNPARIRAQEFGL
jgi:hypothetical protein